MSLLVVTTGNVKMKTVFSLGLRLMSLEFLILATSNKKHPMSFLSDVNWA